MKQKIYCIANNWPNIFISDVMISRKIKEVNEKKIRIHKKVQALHACVKIQSYSVSHQ